MKTKLLIILYIILFASVINAQPERETRAVWVATNFRLDWPPPVFDQDIQKETLDNLFRSIKEKHLNTVYFQVRSSGTVLYNSDTELYSPYITGRPGVKGDYDPAKYAISLARKYGLEIHAWVNVMRCFAGSDKTILDDPGFIKNTNSSWVKKFVENGKTTWWFDPGNPDVRNYLTALFTELAANYDFDGIHLDFMRYPGKQFNDLYSRRAYNPGGNVDDWRRENITSFLGGLYKKIKIIKPDMRIGVTPIGIYKNYKGFFGLEGYHDVYQDSREWIKRGIVDYLVPQIYWGYEGHPKFEILARDWVENSGGIKIITGIASYKPEVKPYTERLINFSRTINADGVAFFRWGNIKEQKFNSFPEITYPASAVATLSDELIPPENFKTVLSPSDNTRVRLSWENSDLLSSRKSEYVTIYESGKNGEEHIVDIVNSENNSAEIKIDPPDKVIYTFKLKAVDKNWRESRGESNSANLEITPLSKMTRYLAPSGNPLLIRKNSNKYSLLLFSPAEDSLNIIIKVLSEEIKLQREIKYGYNRIDLPLLSEAPSGITLRYTSPDKKMELNSGS